MKQPVAHRVTPRRPGIQIRSSVCTRWFAAVPALLTFVGLLSFFVFALGQSTTMPLAAGPPARHAYDSRRLQADARTLLAALCYLAQPERTASVTNQLPVRG